MPAYRYRMQDIGEYLEDDYVITNSPVEADIHVFSKPYHNDWQILKTMLTYASACKNVVFDLCDDLFWREMFVVDYTKDMIRNAKVVTTSCESMKELIKEQTGVDAVVIEDFTYFPKKEIKDISEPKLMWFGTKTNLSQLLRVRTDYPIEVVCQSGSDSRNIMKRMLFDHTFTEWSLESMEEAFYRNNIVILPCGKDRRNLAKGHNRVSESIKSGLSVVASPIPSYQEFSDQIELTEDFENMKFKQLKDQSCIDRFDIKVIGEKWKNLFNQLGLISGVEVAI